MTRQSRLIFLLVCLGAAVRLGAWLYSIFDQRFLVAYKLPDDALYYFATAKHFISGSGISFDGLHPTNGMHPLWLFIILPFFLLHLTDWATVHAVLLFATLLDLITLYFVIKLISFLLRDRSESVIRIAILIAGLSYALNPIVLIRGINGLETVITSLFLVLWCYKFVLLSEGAEHTLKAYILFGLLTGFLLLARTDMILIICVPLAVLLFRRTWVHPTRMTIGLAIGALIVLPWLIWNFITFHTILQSSANAVPYVAMMKFNRAYGVTGKYVYLIGEGLRNMLKPFFYAGLGLSLLSTIFLFVCRIRAKKRGIDTPAQTSVSGRNKGIYIFALTLCGTLILLLFHSVVRGFIREWYVEQFVALFSVLLGVTLALALERIRYSNKSAIGVAIILVTVLISAILEIRTPHMNSQREMVEEGIPMLTHLQSGSTIASFNSGYYGYFHSANETVLNLDGVVSAEAFDSIRHRDLHGYLTKENVGYVLDFQGDLQGAKGLIDSDLLIDYHLDTILRSNGPDNPLLLYERNAGSSSTRKLPFQK